MRPGRVSMLAAAIVVVLNLSNAAGGPQQPGQSPVPGKYISRKIAENVGPTTAHPLISGTNVAWRESFATYEKIRIYKPIISDTAVFDAITSVKTSNDNLQGDWGLSGESLIWTQKTAGQQDIYHADPSLVIFNLTGTAGQDENRALISGSHRAWLAGSGIQVSVDNAVHQIPNTVGAWPRGMSGDYLVYRTPEGGPIELWGYNVVSQQKVRLTDPAYTWGVGDVDIHGSQVGWSAAYYDNGPLYDDYEIYRYDLSLGPIDFTVQGSYEQVTQNNIEDNSVEVAGNRVAWDSQLQGPGYAVSISNGGNLQTLDSSGWLLGISERTVVWGDASGPGNTDLGIVARTNGANFAWQDAETYAAVSGPNLTWAEIHGGNQQIWAAYYLGLGAVLTGIDLSAQELSQLNMSYADMRFTDLRSALIEETNFNGADFTGATNLQYAIGEAIYSHRTLLPEGFDAQAAGWSYVTPEPSALLLALLGLFAAAAWRRRQTHSRELN